MFIIKQHIFLQVNVIFLPLFRGFVTTSRLFGRFANFFIFTGRGYLDSMMDTKKLYL